MIVSPSPCHIGGMPTKIISPELGAELRRLHAEYVIATARAAGAFRTGPPAYDFDAGGLRRFLEEEEKVTKIVRRIKEIQGE
jgi:hypothetical protein